MKTTVSAFFLSLLFLSASLSLPTQVLAQPNAALIDSYISVQKNFARFPDTEKKFWDSSWGHFYPGDALASRGFAVQKPTANRSQKPIRVAVFCSFTFGAGVLEALIKRAATKGDIEIVGVATDEMSDPNAKISKKKRVWKDIDQKDHATYQAMVEVLALSNGIPVYSGQIKGLENGAKSSFFINRLLPRWNPDAILMAGFGQKIINPIAKYPRFGMYNFHPSDIVTDPSSRTRRLSHPGADPFADMKQHGINRTPVAIHHVNEEIDAGHAVGTSDAPVFLYKPGCEENLTIPEILRNMGPISGAAANKLLDKIVRTQAVVYELF